MPFQIFVSSAAGDDKHRSVVLVSPLGGVHLNTCFGKITRGFHLCPCVIWFLQDHSRRSCFCTECGLFSTVFFPLGITLLVLSLHIEKLQYDGDLQPFWSLGICSRVPSPREFGNVQGAVFSGKTKVGGSIKNGIIAVEGVFIQLAALFPIAQWIEIGCLGSNTPGCLT